MDRLHRSVTDADSGFPGSAPRVTLFAEGSKEGHDWYCYTSTMAFDFPDSVAHLTIEFNEEGMRTLGTHLIAAAEAIAQHKRDNPEPIK